MLGLTELDLKISDRLEPLRKILAEQDIPVRTLPNNAGKYSIAEPENSIKTIIPEVNGVPSQTDGVQFINYSIVVAIALDKRYRDDDTEKAVVEWCADEVIKLLYNFYPFEEDGSYTQRPLDFRSYNLFRPDSGTWQSELVFQATKQLRAEKLQLTPRYYDDLQLDLNVVLQQKDPNPVIVKEFKTPS